MQNSRVFDSLYKKLNPDQRKAVDTVEGPVMVIAGPGTGKTTILTLRIANILRQTDTPPSGILAITYTDAGVKAMRTKLREVIGGRADEVRIHTFHGFAAAIIGEFRDHFVHLDRAAQMTDVEAENMIRVLLQDAKFRELRPFGNPDFYIQKIVSAISDCKREAYTPEMVRTFVAAEAKRITDSEESYSTRGKTKGQLKAEFQKLLEKGERTRLFANLYEAYEKKKRADRRMDFDDLIVELLFALEHDELLLRLLQEKFLYMLVDEHQDTNNSQNELVRKLANFFDVPNVFIVGDEKQAIYRFQGASVENFLTFQNVWHDMQIIHLKNNYRSHQSILDASFSMIENNYGEGEHANLRIKLSAAGNEKPRPVDVVSGEDTAATETYLVQQLKTLSAEKPDATIAIITKTNRDLERILRLCEDAEIPVSSQRSIDIFSHPLGSLFFDLAEFLSDPSKTELFAKTVTAGLWGLSFDDSVALLKTLRAGKKGDLDRIVGLKTLRKEMTNDAPLGFIIRAAELSGFTQLIAREPSYVEVWRGIVTLSENLVREGSLIDPQELLKRLVAYRASSEMKSVKVRIGTPDLRIQAMTAHGSKGLEFDYVFIPYATEDSWIGKQWGSYFVLPEARTTNDLRDVRRLFYVALTRARTHVTVLFGLEENGEMLLPLRFVDELSAEHVSRVVLPRATVRKDANVKRSSAPDHGKKIMDYAKTVLTGSGLSVTALNHFLECPSSFLYQSILKLPQAPAAAAEKGTAMHLAFSRIWSDKDRSEPNIRKIIQNTIASYFEDSLLPAFEKEAIQKELQEDIPVIAQELRGHFGQPGTVFAETWSESQFLGSFEKQGITIPIHGKLDAIIDADKEAFVFDYKTKQVMSENDIRGNTKTSNGNYFRQLVFYKLLLQNDSRFSEKNIIPSLVFVIPDSKGRCPTVTLPIEAADIETVRENIQTLIDSVWSGTFMTDTCKDPKCEWCSLRQMLV